MVERYEQGSTYNRGACHDDCSFSGNRYGLHNN